MKLQYLYITLLQIWRNVEGYYNNIILRYSDVQFAGRPTIASPLPPPPHSTKNSPCYAKTADKQSPSLQLTKYKYLCMYYVYLCKSYLLNHKLRLTLL